MKPFDKGRKAFTRNKPGNPFNVNTQSYRDWDFGYNQEFFKQLEKVSPGSYLVSIRERIATLKSNNQKVHPWLWNKKQELEDDLR